MAAISHAEAIERLRANTKNLTDHVISWGQWDREVERILDPQPLKAREAMRRPGSTLPIARAHRPVCHYPGTIAAQLRRRRAQADGMHPDVMAHRREA